MDRFDKTKTTTNLPHTASALCITTLLLVAAQTAHANDLSATINLTSDYVFRGVSLTDGPALQGSIDYSFDNGLYIGSWTSNYDYDSATNRELDYYLGYSQSLGHGTTLSASASRYTFFDEHDIDYNEYQLGLSRGRLDAKIWYADDYSGTGGDAQYFEAGFTSPLAHSISLELRAGYSIFDNKIGIDDYADFVVAAKKAFGRFDTELRLTGTDGNQFGNREDVRIIASVSTTFQ